MQTLFNNYSSNTKGTLLKNLSIKNTNIILFLHINAYIYQASIQNTNMIKKYK